MWLLTTGIEKLQIASVVQLKSEVHCNLHIPTYIYGSSVCYYFVVYAVIAKPAQQQQHSFVIEIELITKPSYIFLDVVIYRHKDLRRKNSTPVFL